MNKDLNKEYSEMIRTDLPDLWDRISENLPEKQEKPRKTKIYRFAVVAAACICVAILIPVIAVNSRAGRSSGTMETAAAMAEDKAEQKTAAAAEEAAEAAMEETAEAGMEEAAEAVKKEAGSEAAVPETMTEGTEAATAAKDKEAAASAENGTRLIYNATVNITAIRDKEADRQILEAVVVTGGDNGELETGKEILLVIDSLTPPELVEELSVGITEFDLERRETEEGVLFFIR